MSAVKQRISTSIVEAARELGYPIMPEQLDVTIAFVEGRDEGMIILKFITTFHRCHDTNKCNSCI